ncbi:hypothetical protein GUITHDRAFT_86282 [Guillardia theta CCMP2712]|uniref:Branched-chain-amino-acid aminotransferase n=1 Tax=Guillardia theta (strain CCMP2712) TaxID=905079 RepID=L1JG97_GUITC|nr:hypothetical protein GUITHDRAFT_86282 [Guillardia theta CCMP2712]EKX47543.1 hypothetical protein GUITHDRAFT_86282 [Guillardia theta CCMP2712]|eukprot:XP_005834523.1 hypothetical protein GUITHDRAFT_86282 [Guillardia theta CCMP2712]
MLSVKSLKGFQYHAFTAFVHVVMPRPTWGSRTFATSGSSIDSSLLKIQRATALKPKPVFDNSLPFGKFFTDHMLEIEWDEKDGFSAPQIVPHHPLSIDAAAPCLHYGVQCFEGMKAYKDKSGVVRLFRPDKNMKRLNDSCQRLSMPMFDGNQFIECLKQFLKVDRDWIPDKDGFSLYIRPTVIATSSSLGVHPAHHALFYVIACPVGPYFKDGFAPVKVLAESKFKRAWPGGTGCNKVGGNYAPGLLPQKMAAQQGYSQVLWLFGEEDYVTEVGSMNFFVFWKRADGKRELITAPLDGTILPGVTRDSILELTREWREFEVSEKTFTMADLINAANEGRVIEIFGAGTAAIVSPINGISYMGKEYAIPCGKDGRAGELSTRLFHELCDIQYGRKQFRDWSVAIH